MGNSTEPERIINIDPSKHRGLHAMTWRGSRRLVTISHENLPGTGERIKDRRNVALYLSDRKFVCILLWSVRLVISKVDQISMKT